MPLLGNKGKVIEKPEIDMVEGENGPLARIRGRIDIDSSPSIRTELFAILEASTCRVVRIDLSAVTHIDSSGVATLIEVLRMARTRNTELRLEGLEGRLLRLFQLTGILSLFNGGTAANNKFESKAV